ncbi:MAG: hypothetical protein HYY92_02850 [Parcubacteria group bacterium]|nr:hypothetical protein [Parcubacteria group bacterium]
MSPQKIQDIIVQRPGSKIPKRIFGSGGAQEEKTAPRIGLASKSGDGAAPRYPRFSSVETPPRKKTRMVVWGAAIFAALVLIFASSTFFEKATLQIVPKQKAALFDSIIVARKGATQTAKNLLPFELMEITDSVSRDVAATAVEKVLRRASGTVVIYNNFGAESQRLIKNTRFEAPDGKIYRIRESVTVPGQKTENGKTAPGSVEAVMYADEPGTEYNKGLSDFTIPGFKGTPRFAKFYARGKTEIAGGFSGEQKTLNEEEFKKVTAELRKEAENALRARAYAEKPQGFVLFDDGVFLAFKESELPVPKDETRETVTVTAEATLYGALFDENVLGAFIAEKLSFAEEGTRAAVTNFSELDFKIIDKENFNPEDDMQFSFTMKGKPHFVWEFDAEKLREELKGAKKSNLAAVLAEFPSITRAEVTFRPFWKRSFPDEVKDIVIESVSDESNEAMKQ